MPSDPTRPGRSRVRLTSETLAAKAAELTSQALLLLLVPPALGPGSYGEFAVAFGAVSLISLGLGLGAPLAAIRYLPAVAAEERLTHARAIARDVARSRALVLGPLSVAAAVLGPVAFDVPLGVTLALCAAAWCSVGSSVASELALGLGRHRVWNVRFPLENALVVVAALAGDAVVGGDGAIYGMAAACALTFALLLPRAAAGLRRAPAGDPLPREAVTYARQQTASVILGTLVMRGAPLAMPLAGASSVQTGFAAIATGVGAAGAATIIGLELVQVPRLVQLARGGAEDVASSEAEREAFLSARVALALAMVAALPAALFAEPGLRLALGSAFADAHPALELALPAIPLGAAVGLASVTAALRLRPGVLTAGWSAAAAVFAVLAAATIPSLHAEGASIAMTGGVLAACLTTTAMLGTRRLHLTAAASVAGAAVVLAAGAL